MKTKTIRIIKLWTLERGYLKQQKDYNGADEVRDRLLSCNVKITDNKNGTSNYHFMGEEWCVNLKDAIKAVLTSQKESGKV